MANVESNKSFFDWLMRSNTPKIATLCIVPLSIILLFVYSLSSFNTTDQSPEFSIIDVQKQKEFGAFTVKVKTGLYIKNFTKFDVLNNQFIFDALLWFEFYPNEIMLENISKFTVDNGKVINKSAPDLKVVGDVVLASYDIRIDCKANLDFVKFPFEDHKLSIVITNNAVTPYEMFFIVDNTTFNTAPDLNISNWNIKSLNTDSGYFQPGLDTKQADKASAYPKAIFTMNVQKTGIRKVLVIFLPIFLVMILSLFSFLMALANYVGRATLATAGVTAELGYRFVLDKMIPDVSYFTIADSLYLVLLVASFLVFVAQTFIGRYCTTVVDKLPEDKRGEGIVFAEKINGFTFYIIAILVLGLTFYLMLR
ncbi:hypothetical protein FJ366_03180 [Candidatus Dependentiae bacterium]|nr:hypothetical protein [Candidatus Dependentiae bacterium]